MKTVQEIREMDKTGKLTANAVRSRARRKGLPVRYEIGYNNLRVRVYTEEEAQEILTFVGKRKNYGKQEIVGALDTADVEPEKKKVFWEELDG